MTDPSPPLPPAARRQLGRSRNYSRDDLPKRLINWHAPRANRWERLFVTAGTLQVQWLLSEGIHAEALHAGDDRWIAPGTRWRVAHMGAATCFALEVHADDATPVSTPQHSRADWFAQAQSMQVDDETAFTRLLSELAAGTQHLLRGRFELADAHLRATLDACDHSLYWHALDRGHGCFTAFVARATEPVGLLEYLGRDHAVIEATLAGTLRGDAEHAHWLQGSLERHMGIEESLLFPAYLHAGGNAGWVRGLCNEHGHLRRHLHDASSEPAARRRFLLLLDGHDEKEEQIVYPDILARLGADADALVRAAMLYPTPHRTGI